eukprot:Awhi_evm2s14682
MSSPFLDLSLSSTAAAKGLSALDRNSPETSPSKVQYCKRQVSGEGEEAEADAKKSDALFGFMSFSPMEVRKHRFPDTELRTHSLDDSRSFNFQEPLEREHKKCYSTGKKKLAQENHECIGSSETPYDNMNDLEKDNSRLTELLEISNDFGMANYDRTLKTATASSSSQFSNTNDLDNDTNHNTTTVSKNKDRGVNDANGH